MYRYSPLQRRFMRAKFQGYKVAHRANGRPMTLRNIQETLNGYGYPCGRVDGKWGPMTSAATRRFQEAFNGGKTGRPWLIIDGELGPRTRSALFELPHLSPHFTALEVASKGNGDAYVKRDLLVALEKERTELNRPLRLISVYRDPAHNAAVGGARYSRHLYGEAADISRNYNLQLETIKAKYRYGGIGALSKTLRVTHVDVRPGSTTRPRIWYYPE